MVVIDLVRQFFAGELDFTGIYDDDEIPGIHVRGVNGFMLAPQPPRNFSGQSSQNFTLCINNVPIFNPIL